MFGIDELCKDLFEMSGIVSEMYIYLRILNKWKEFVEFYERFLGIGDLFFICL